LDSLLTVGLVLHPSHKLEYFKQADWDDEWCEAALDIVRTMFECAYINSEVEDEDDDDEVSTNFIPSLTFFFFQFSLQVIDHAMSDNIFDALPTVSAPAKPTPINELDHYLAAPTEATRDPLLWWVEKQAVYPHLSRMARDYLCVPGVFHNLFVI
jgi:hypothetical protein